jgi:DeoR/GlpR family transcriptional regulator of sugar metabolism
MLTSERKAHIRDVLRRDGRVLAKAISRELGLSEDTIRRDLRELAADGVLQRVHGGALPASPAVADYAARRDIAAPAKAALARAGAGLISQDQVVFIDGGTTHVQLARALAPDLRATVVTHSPSIAVELADHPLIQVELIGGRLFKHSVVAMGAAALEAIARIRPDLFFMGVTGAHAEAGLTTGDAEEAAMKRSISRQSSETVVLVTSDKLGAASPFQILPMAEASTLVVERDAPERSLESVAALGVTILRARR